MLQEIKYGIKDHCFEAEQVNNNFYTDLTKRTLLSPNSYVYGEWISKQIRLEI